MLAVAADWRPGTCPRSGTEIVRAPHLAHYIVGWPLRGDFGIIADHEGSPIGAPGAATSTPNPVATATSLPICLSSPSVAWRRGEVEASAGSCWPKWSFMRNAAGQTDQPQRRRGQPALALYADVGFVEVSRAADSPTMVLDCAAT